jgi:hypothetical protein
VHRRFLDHHSCLAIRTESRKCRTRDLAPLFSRECLVRLTIRDDLDLLGEETCVDVVFGE